MSASPRTRRLSRSRRFAHGLALSAVASMAVLAPTAALADDESMTDDVDTSESTTTVPTPEVPDPTPPPAEQDSTDAAEPEPEVEQTNGDDGAEKVGEEDAADEREAAVLLQEAEVEDEVIVPDTGFGKFSQPIRIGVDLAEGTYVPAGVTTAGSVLQITETGPDVEGGSITTECTTQADTAQGTATFCEFEQPFEAVLDLPESVGPFAVVFPENPDATQNGQLYRAERTSTVTVTQIGVPAGLVGDPESATVTPCAEDTEIPPLFEFEIPAPCTRQVALLEDTGLPPVATDDSASTRENFPVTIDVLANDDTVAGAPLTGFDFAAAPQNGSVEIVGTEDAPQVRYTPDRGFVGTDTFSYGFATPNGVAFADVTVTVRPVPAAAVPPGVEARVVSLPDTGGPSLTVLGWAAALLVAGAGLLAAGRRRKATR